MLDEENLYSYCGDSDYDPKGEKVFKYCLYGFFICIVLLIFGWFGDMFVKIGWTFFSEEQYWLNVFANSLTCICAAIAFMYAMSKLNFPLWLLILSGLILWPALLFLIVNAYGWINCM